MPPKFQGLPNLPAYHRSIDYRLSTMPRLVYLLTGCLAFNSFKTNAFSVQKSTLAHTKAPPSSSTSLAATRRSWLQDASKNLAVGATSSVLMIGASSGASAARVVTDITSGNLPDLPPEAQRSYLQYRKRISLHVAPWQFRFCDTCSLSYWCH